MAERKFTPPTTFPAEYVTRDGRKAFIISEMPDDDYPYLGYFIGNEGKCWLDTWTKEGLIIDEECEPEECADDLFDFVPEPQKPDYAGRIEALTEQLEAARLDAKEAEAYSVWLEKQLAKAADVIELALIRWDEHYEYGVFMDNDWVEDARAILAEAKGHKP